MEGRNHWATKELSSQEEIDLIFEKLKKENNTCDIDQEAVLNNVGQKEKALKKISQKEKIFLLNQSPFIKRKLVNPLETLILNQLNEVVPGGSVRFMTIDLSNQVEFPLIISTNFESLFGEAPFLTREFSYKRKFHKFSLSMGNDPLCKDFDDSTLEDFLSKLGQSFNRLLNKKMIFGHVFSHCSKDIFDLQLSSNYFTPIVLISYSLHFKEHKNNLFLALPFELTNHYLNNDEELIL